ncbi:MAG: IucA/IucC family protein [Egibacteraceae bacterium]
MTEEERRTLAFLRAEVPHLAGAFLDHLARARRTTLGHLVAAMLREDVAQLGARSYAAPGVRPARVVSLAPDARLVIGIGQETAFGRLRVDGPVMHLEGKSCRELTHPVELLCVLEAAGHGGGGAWRELTHEVSDSVANLAMAYACVEERSAQMGRRARERGATGAGQLGVLADPLLDSTLLFERLCAEGHNLHPCGRVRKGMSPAESYRYAAECAGVTDLALVAVRADHVLSTPDEQGSDVTEILFDHFPHLEQTTGQALAARELSTRDYLVMPVHPWQRTHALPQTYPDELRIGVIVPLDGVSLPAASTISLRSVVTGPGRHGRRLVVKAALDVLLTSTYRNISAATTYNGPRISRLLACLFAAEPKLRDRVTAVSELAGAAFQPGDTDGEPSTRRQRNLSVLLREDPTLYLQPGEVAITGCALYATSPVTGRSVLADLVEQFRAAHAPAHDHAALAWLAEYTALFVPMILIMLTKYGIGLEAHLQNTLVVFRDGRPVRLLLRDFAGLRLNPARLAAAGVTYQPYPGSITVTDDIAQVRTKVFYASLQANLAEIITRLVADFDLPEATCWRLVWQEAERVFARLAADPALVTRVRADRDALYAPRLGQKAFTRMRLQPQAGDIFHEMPNPLHALSRAAATRSRPAL